MTIQFKHLQFSVEFDSNFCCNAADTFPKLNYKQLQCNLQVVHDVCGEYQQKIDFRLVSDLGLSLPAKNKVTYTSH